MAGGWRGTGRFAAVALLVAILVVVTPGAQARPKKRISKSNAVVSNRPIPETIYQQLQLLDVQRRATLPNTFKCSNCPLEPDGSGRPMHVRVMFVDSYPATQNPAAQAAAQKAGTEYSCDDPKLAVPECFVADNWNEGWVGEFANLFLKELNMNVTALTRANFSKEVAEVYKGGSSYTRCVWEVRLGNVDLCVGDFWETEERRGIAPFASAMDSDVLKLGTLSLGSSDAIRLASIFDPFTIDVWIVNLVMIAVSALCLWIVEVTTSELNSDYDDQLVPRSRLSYLKGLSKSLWLGAMGYVSGGAAHATTTWPGRFIALGFGFFVYISVSSYTANLASFMITSSTALGLISAYSDISDAAGNLCLLEAIETMVKTPGVGKVAFDDYIPAIEGLYASKCLGVQVGRNEWKTIVRGGRGQGSICIDPADTKGHSSCADPDGLVKKIQISGCTCTDASIVDAALCPEDCPDHRKYCSLLEINDEAFAFYMNFALPVSTKIQDYVSAWIIGLRQEGAVQRLKSKYIDAVTPDVCGGAVDVESQSLGIKSMAGTFVISGAFMFTGLVWHLVTLFMRPAREKKPRGMFDVASPKDEIKGEVVGAHSPGKIGGDDMKPLSQKSPDDLWGSKHPSDLSTMQYDDLCGKLAEHQKLITQQGRVLERTERMITAQEGQLEQILSLLAELPSKVPAHAPAAAAAKPPRLASFKPPETSQTAMGGGESFGQADMQPNYQPRQVNLEDVASKKHHSPRGAAPSVSFEQEKTTPVNENSNPILGFLTSIGGGPNR